MAMEWIGREAAELLDLLRRVRAAATTRMRMTTAAIANTRER